MFSRTDYLVHDSYFRYPRVSFLAAAVVLLSLASGPAAMGQGTADSMNVPGLGNINLGGISLGSSNNAPVSDTSKGAPQTTDHLSFSKENGINPHKRSGMGSFRFVAEYRNDLYNEIMTFAMQALSGSKDPSPYMHTRDHEDPEPPLVEVDGVRMKGLKGEKWYADPRAIWNAAPETIAVMDIYDDPTAIQHFGSDANYGAIIVRTTNAANSTPAPTPSGPTTDSTPGSITNPPAASPGTANVTAPILLTTDLVTHFVALKKDLAIFWKDKSRQAILADAKAHHHVVTAKFGDQNTPVSTFDYQTLVKRDTTLAHLFKKHEFDPAEFEPFQVAAWAALGALVIDVAVDSTTVAGKNIAVVKLHRQDLASVGIAGTKSDGAPTMNP